MHRKVSVNPGRKEDRLYTLDVFLISGPIAAEFARRNRVISRTIQIRGDQKLEELHRAIFAAVDREENHFCLFTFGERCLCGNSGSEDLHLKVLTGQPRKSG